MMTEQGTRLNYVDLHQQYYKLNPVAHARTLLLGGNYQACLKFIQLQPTHMVEKSAQMLVYLATAMLFSEYSQDKILAVLTQAEHLDKAKIYIGEIKAIKAIISSYSDAPEKGIELSEMALQHIHPENTFFQNIVERNLGIAYTLKNDLGTANTWFEKLLMSSYQLEDWGSVLASYNYLTYLRKVQGRLWEAETIYRKALDVIEDHNLEYLPHSIKIISGYGHLLMYWNQLDEAKIFFRRALQLAGRTEIIYGYTAYQHLCETYIRENNLDAAQVVMKELQQCVGGKEDFYKKIHIESTKMLKAHLLVETGQVELANEWLVSSGFNDVNPNHLIQHYGYTLGSTLPLAARIYLLQGKTEQALLALRAVIPKFIHQGANSFLIRALAALAVAYDHSGQPDQAQKSLIKALSLADSENNLGDFLLIGYALIPVLTEVLNNYPSQFAHSLITLFQKNVPFKNASQTRNFATNPLSKREIDVINLVAEGMSNHQIAESLFLSNNTIKSHINALYRKLDVNDRETAINKARKIGILMPEKTPQLTRVSPHS